jgi:GNAT superfamily N-acetyltransferase
MTRPGRVAYVSAMPSTYVRPFRADDIPAAGVLLAARHRTHRLSCRLLSPRYEHESAATAEVEECLAGWEDDFDDPAYTTFVAEFEGIVIGSSIGCSLELSGSHPPVTRPDHAGFLAFAAVVPHTRGLGAGRALGEAVLAWAAQAGYHCVATVSR